MKRLLLLLLVVPAVAGCSSAAETPKEQQAHKQISELETPESPLRKSLEKAAEHLPPGASVEEQTAQAEREAR